jgi:hypothetical protein
VVQEGGAQGDLPHHLGGIKTIEAAGVAVWSRPETYQEEALTGVPARVSLMGTIHAWDR